MLGAKIENLTLTGVGAIDGTGNAGANAITGNIAANKLSGHGNSDTLAGLGGNDRLDGGADADAMSGGNGNDTYVVDNAGDTTVELAGEGSDLVQSSISHTLAANVDNLTLTGTGAINGTGNAGANILLGNYSANLLQGAGGGDTLDGGGDQDVCTGGTGADAFVFQDGDFAGLETSTCDAITDFSQAQGDLIDLSGVDADTSLAGDQGLAFIGGAAFTNVAGELRFEQVDGNTYLQGDTDGDSIADFMIRLDGLHTLASNDFMF